MTKHYYYLDKRVKNKSGESQVKIGISKNRKTAFLPTGVWVFPHHWDEKENKVVGHANADSLNFQLMATWMETQKTLVNLQVSGAIVQMDVYEVRDQIQKSIDPEKMKPKTKKKNLFASVFERFKESKTKPGTHAPYQTTWNHMHKYDSKLAQRKFEDIDMKWLEGYDKYLMKTVPSKNARNIHFRNIRAVFNHAIDEEITTFYPFRKFKIKPQETVHRAMTVEQVRLLRDYPCEEYQEKYRDMFMLMIYLAGINAVDLFTPNHAKMYRGRIEYFRMKTQKDGSSGKFISVKIEPEAQAYLDKYYDYEKGIFRFMEGRATYKSFLRQMSVELKRIGTYERKGRGGKKVYTPLFPEISQYWSRHTWATLAIERDVPENTVSYALGHDTRIATTSIYIKVNQKKLDEANRTVIDYINEK